MIKAARLIYTPPLLAVVSHGVAVATYEDVSSTGREWEKTTQEWIKQICNRAVFVSTYAISGFFNSDIFEIGLGVNYGR